MTLTFPSPEFEEAVAAVCHGRASEEQMRAVHELLRASPTARDEYLFCVELHSRLASEPDLYANAGAEPAELVSPTFAAKAAQNTLPLPFPARRRPRVAAWPVALAASFVLLAALGFALWLKRPASRETTSMAVAVLARVVDAQWQNAQDAPTAGAALEPGWLRLKSGLLEVVFYSGARLVVEGPAEVRLLSRQEAFCQSGRLVADVQHQARGFRIGTPQLTVVDLGTAFGLEVRNARAEVHVFKGEVEVQAQGVSKQSLKEGQAGVVEGTEAPKLTAANPAFFAALFDLQRKTVAMQELRQEQWRAASTRLHQDRSLLVHLDFEDTTASEWVLHNKAVPGTAAPEATIVGCQWSEGRWPGKHALEFRSVSDRVRFHVPGKFRALTVAAWVNVKGLDREFNSLFMCDGFDYGKIHWQIRNDGVLDLGVQGPQGKDLKIFASPAVIGFNQFGQWLHLAAVVDGEHGRVIHFVNGTPVSRHTLRREPVFRIGEAELGNWNPGEIPDKPPFLIRHFSGAMDEFALFKRALSDTEVRQLYTDGKPQAGSEPLASRR